MRRMKILHPSHLLYSSLNLPNLWPSCSIPLFIALSISLASKNYLLQSILISTANPTSITTSKPLNCCSACIGHVASRTPNHPLSSIELHPPCDLNYLMEGWAKTSTCGAHPITFPVFAVRSKHPSGKTFCRYTWSTMKSILLLYKLTMNHFSTIFT